MLITLSENSSRNWFRGHDKHGHARKHAQWSELVEMSKYTYIIYVDRSGPFLGGIIKSSGIIYHDVQTTEMIHARFKRV